MVGDGEAVGAIFICRRQVREFTERLVELVTALAEQAVIALDNVRRFRALDEALERQTATSEVPRVQFAMTRSTATTATKIEREVYSRRRKAIAPSWM